MIRRTFRPALTCAQLEAQVAALDHVLAQANAHRGTHRDYSTLFNAQLAERKTSLAVSFSPMQAQGDDHG